MKTKIALLVSLLFAFGAAHADEKRSDEKKSEKAKQHSAKKKSEKKSEKKPEAKSDKNVFQRTESSVGDWANRNKIWVRSSKKEADKK